MHSTPPSQNPRRTPRANPGPDPLPRPRAGTLERIVPGIRRILAPNPSPMTYWGTNTFLVGTGSVTVIDPGPPSPAHLRAILAGLDRGERIARILVSHAHLDHSPLARPLAETTGAKVYAYGGAAEGRSQVMQALAVQGLAGGGEGVDQTFAPDVRLANGETLDIGNGARLRALWTPGHFASHLCFALEGGLEDAPGGGSGDVVFTGDHVMGWASTLISPPDGDLTAYLASCERLRRRGDVAFLPAHGPAVYDPGDRLAWLIDHRRNREAQVLAALGTGPATIPQLVAKIYTDTDRRLLPAAERNVFAHLIDLESRGRVRARPSLAFGARFERIA